MLLPVIGVGFGPLEVDGCGPLEVDGCGPGSVSKSFRITLSLSPRISTLAFMLAV